MPRCKRFDVTNMLGGGRRLPILGRRTTYLRPGEEDGCQNSAEFNAPFHRNTHGCPPAYLLCDANDVPATLRENAQLLPTPMSMAPVGLACLLECFEYNNDATQPVSFYSESDS